MANKKLGQVGNPILPLNLRLTSGNGIVFITGMMMLYLREERF